MLEDILILIAMLIVSGLLFAAGLVLWYFRWFGPKSVRRFIFVVSIFSFIGTFILYSTGAELTVGNLVGTMALSWAAGIAAAILIRNKCGD